MKQLEIIILDPEVMGGKHFILVSKSIFTFV